MATANSNQFQEFNDVLGQMKHEHKVKRRKALEKYHEMVFEKETASEQNYLRDVLDFSMSSLTPRLSDESEVNRINVANIILKFSNADVISEKYLIDIIPVVCHRISVTPQIEESEDVRLLFVNILQDLVRCMQDKLISYMNDIVNILKVSVLDGSPEVRKASCECVSAFAKACKDKFHMQSESLVKPLIKGLNHQRFRNRIACINSLGNILLYGDDVAIKEISGPLAQCSMDIPQVRLVLVTLGGTLAMEMSERYSYWHYILPLFLFGLCDDDNEIKSKAETVWSEVGKKYEVENEDQLKEELNFGGDIPNFPDGEKPPSVGCRTLVNKSMYHILPGLLGDLDDWQSKPRLQAAKLLTTLVLNAGTGLIQYAEKILTALHLAAGDREEDIVRQVIVCSEYLGHFLPPSTYLPLVLPRLSEGNKGERPLLILSALVRGSQDSQVAAEITTIVQTISAEDVARVYDPSHQSALLELISVILPKCDVQEDSYGLFCTLVFIASSSQHSEVVDRTREQLGVLATKGGFSCTDELFKAHLKTLLIELQLSSDAWLEHSPKFQMFIGIMELGGQALGDHLEHIVGVLCTCVPKKHDPLVSLRCLIKMEQLLRRDDSPLQSSNQLGIHLSKFVAECLVVLLPWHAGRTASSLRTAALACFIAVCEVKDIEETMVVDVKRCLDLIPALIEDEAEDTRLLTCDAVRHIKSNYPQLIESDTLHKIADKFAKRLDDVQAAIRLKAAGMLSILFTSLPDGYDISLQSARLKELYERTVIFLDDPDVRLQEAVINALNVMGKVSPNLLTSVLEKDCHKYRNKQHCTKLIEALKSLSVEG